MSSDDMEGDTGLHQGALIDLVFISFSIQDFLKFSNRTIFSVCLKTLEREREKKDLILLYRSTNNGKS